MPGGLGSVEVATAAAASACSAASAAGLPCARLSCCGTVVDVSHAHLVRLWARWRATKAAAGSGEATSESAGAAELAAFATAAFCAACRVLSLQGGDERAGGMQAACPQAVFTALGVQSEAFASPFNAISPSFCSASADVDAPFGSCGSFFALEPPAGAVLLANPPFDGATVLAMARRIAAWSNRGKRE